MKMKEVWKEIDFNSDYSVSNQGRIKNNRTGRILKPFINTFGYEQVELGNKQVLVSRLVAKAFVPNPDPLYKTQVNHINEFRRDNRATNLNWMTPKENINWATRTDRSSKNHKKKVIAINNYSKDMIIYDSITEARISTGITSISSYCKGKLVQSRSGLTFRYLL